MVAADSFNCSIFLVGLATAPEKGRFKVAAGAVVLTFSVAYSHILNLPLRPFRSFTDEIYTQVRSICANLRRRSRTPHILAHFRSCSGSCTAGYSRHRRRQYGPLGQARR